MSFCPRFDSAARWALSVFVSGLMTGACGESTSSSNDTDAGNAFGELKLPAGAGTGRYMPLGTGVKWTYRVTEANMPTGTKLHAIMGLEDVPGLLGKKAFKVVTTKSSGGVPDRTESWQEDTGNAVIRYMEDSYAPGQASAKLRESWAPFKLRLDEAPEKLQPGVSYSVMYRETHREDPGSAGGRMSTQDRMERWTVESVSDTLVVNGTTLTKLLRIKRMGTDQGATSNKTFWYMRGVGKVKEVGSQTEELVAVQGL